ncbi:MAG TPA: hypothetical protein VIQ29_25255 [Ancylobacter sp.]
MTAIRFTSRKIYWYALLVFVLLAVRSILTSDVSVAFYQSKGVDEGLYVERAIGILEHLNFGNYAGNWGVFAKLPGFSVVLAIARALKIPYDVFIRIFEFGACLLMVGVLARAKVGAISIVVALLLLTASPFYYAADYFRILREPVATAIFICIAALFLQILSEVSRGFLNGFSLLLISILIAAGHLLREESFLLYYILPVLLAASSFVVLMRRSASRRLSFGLPLLILVVPLATIQAGDLAARSWIVRIDGVGILNEYNEGELPRLIAAMNGVEVGAERDLRVVVSQKQLDAIIAAVPDFAPPIMRMRSDYPIGKGSIYCEIYDVCDEMTTTHFQFFLRMAAWRLDKTPTLVATQSYFRGLRLDIEAACQTGRLQCVKRSDNRLMGWPSYRVLEATAKGTYRIFARMVESAPPPLTNKALRVNWYQGAQQLEAIVRSGNVDMVAEFFWASAFRDNPDVLNAMVYYARYPDVAMSANYGVNGTAGPNRAFAHYRDSGKSEGRLWGLQQSAPPVLENFERRVRLLRDSMGGAVRLLNQFAIPLSVAAIFAMIGLDIWRRTFPVLHVWIASVFAFLVLQLLAFGYLNSFFIQIDDRLLMPVHQMVVILGPIAAMQLFKRDTQRPPSDFAQYEPKS